MLLHAIDDVLVEKVRIAVRAQHTNSEGLHKATRLLATVDHISSAIGSCHSSKTKMIQGGRTVQVLPNEAQVTRQNAHKEFTITKR